MGHFHIHIDAFSMSEEFNKFLIEDLGFWRSDFAGHPDGVEHFEPNHHLTQKVASSEEFKALFDTVVDYATTHHVIDGYIEGEWLAMEKDIAPRPFDPSVNPPFTFSTKPLPAEAFRETEIHITLSRDDSDQRLLRALESMGFFAAYLPKPDGMAQIFTVQGSKEKIRSLLPSLIEYLEKAGGGVRCKIKEERVAKWWKSSPDALIPPVVESINWLG